MLSRAIVTPGAPKGVDKFFDHNNALNSQESSQSGSDGKDKLNMGVVLLTVLNATSDDSGLFWCVADNGVGGKTVRNATLLLVRRKFLLSAI